MTKSNTNIFINSLLAFVTAFIITTVFHELGHYLSYVFYGADPTLFHNFVQTPNQILDIKVKIISAFAGPVISAVQGIIFALIVIKSKRNTSNHLFFLWLSLLGFVNFFGYLIITPFSTIGDTGKVAELLNMDFTIRAIIAVVGFITLIWVILNVAKNFANFIPMPCKMDSRVKYVYRLMFFPIIIGSLINTVLAFPVVAILSIIYPATSPYVIMISFPMILKAKSHHVSKPNLETRISKQLVIFALCAIFLNRLLTLGIG
ncbi:MAG: hypothetical protein D8M58_14430 [Calditrichaeota bacterium]|nr:MAG: hypothetical protein DWQ03_15670 [Calditrichota bacterium]MBL1206598.1 hypothetical protein [Calditrichota bacterium]NOG46425.1 hypothetical protein [Calditrichota bacterium]